MRTPSHLAVGSPTARFAAILVATLLLSLALAAAGIAGARLLAADGTIIVAQDGSGTVETVSEAIAMAEDGDTILLRPGTYRGGFELTRDVELRGDGPLEDIIISVDEGPIMAVLETNAVISGITFTGPDSDGIIVRGGSPTMEANSFRSVGRPYFGGSSCARPCVSLLVTDGSTATVRDNTFADGGELGADGGAAPIFEGNELTNGPHIPLFAVGDGTVVRDNVISGPVVRGIGTFGTNQPLIERNTIMGAPTGIDIWVGRPRVSGNTVSGSTAAAISVIEAAQPTIEDNTLTESISGISIDSRAEITIERNRLEGNGVGITLGNGSVEEPALVDNSFCGNEVNVLVPVGREVPDLSDNQLCPDDPEAMGD